VANGRTLEHSLLVNTSDCSIYTKHACSTFYGPSSNIIEGHLARRHLHNRSATTLELPGTDWGSTAPPPRPGMRERERERERESNIMLIKGSTNQCIDGSADNIHWVDVRFDSSQQCTERHWLCIDCPTPQHLHYPKTRNHQLEIRNGTWTVKTCCSNFWEVFPKIVQRTDLEGRLKWRIILSKTDQIQILISRCNKYNSVAKLFTPMCVSHQQ